MKKIIICIDRDGTLINDEKYHLFLGKDNDWKSKVKILPNVIDGLQKMKEIPNSAIYMITNQSGVAISDYPLLTYEKAHKVCRYVVDKLKENDVSLDGYFLCPHATPEYVSRKTDINFDHNLVHNCGCLKPALGMVFSALESEGVTYDNASIYVLGDRSTDIQTALNIKGFGILIPFENEPGEEKKVKMLSNHSHRCIVENLLSAAEVIKEREK